MEKTISYIISKDGLLTPSHLEDRAMPNFGNMWKVPSNPQEIRQEMLQIQTQSKTMFLEFPFLVLTTVMKAFECFSQKLKTLIWIEFESVLKPESRQRIEF